MTVAEGDETTTETKHTEGPWTVALNELTIKAGDRTVAHAHKGIFAAEEWPEAKANARLIAAAPMLLQAAEDALESLSRLDNKDGAYRVSVMRELRDVLTAARSGR